MAQLNSKLAVFPEEIGRQCKSRDFSKLPKRISLFKLVKVITNGKTGSYPRMSRYKRNEFKSFLTRMREAFGSDVKFDGRYFVFSREITADEWIKATKANVPFYGRGSRNYGEPALRDSINRILDYVIENDESVITIDQLNLITLGTNCASLVSDSGLKYGKESFQSFQVLFDKLGLKATVKETRSIFAEALVEEMPEYYKRDWSSFTSTQLILEYKDIEQVKKAKENLKEMKILGGYFRKKIVMSAEDGKNVTINVTAKMVREATKKAELICHDVDAVKQVLIENQIYQNTFKLAEQIKEKLEEKVKLLEKQQAELENYITAVTNS